MRNATHCRIVSAMRVGLGAEDCQALGIATADEYRESVATLRQQFDLAALYARWRAA